MSPSWSAVDGEGWRSLSPRHPKQEGSSPEEAKQNLPPLHFCVSSYSQRPQTSLSRTYDTTTGLMNAAPSAFQSPERPENCIVNSPSMEWSVPEVWRSWSLRQAKQEGLSPLSRRLAKSPEEAKQNLPPPLASSHRLQSALQGRPQTSHARRGTYDTTGVQRAKCLSVGTALNGTLKERVTDESAQAAAAVDRVYSELGITHSSVAKMNVRERGQLLGRLKKK